MSANLRPALDVFFPAPFPPRWASDWGEDQYGEWVGLTHRDIRQGFRWLAPGQFLMGSPADEAERRNDETQHEVMLTEGYWLADTACTQALWQAVMGENPSRFSNDPQNPVEQVSWGDVDEFIRRLNQQVNQQVPELKACLPTEAQWEYACRAGTRTPYSFGANVTPEQVNYDGHYPYAGGAKGPYREQTVAVSTLPANPWGLYEMHGNVWEWCADWSDDYGDAAQMNPVGPTDGASRGLRGGSWFDGGRSARSANRFGGVPGDRGDVGFRLALGQGE